MQPGERPGPKKNAQGAFLGRRGRRALVQDVGEREPEDGDGRVETHPVVGVI